MDKYIRTKDKESSVSRSTNSQNITSTTNTNSSNNNTSSSINDANTLYQKEMTKYNEAMKEAETKRNADAAQAKQTGDAIAGFTGAVVNNFMEQSARNNERKNAIFLRSLEIKQQNEEKANTALKYFLPEAEKGNEQAIAKVAEAYALLEDPEKYINEISTDGYYVSYRPEKYEVFLSRMYTNYHSPKAQNLLKNYYTEVIGGFKKVSKLHKRKAISRTIWGSIFVAGGVVGSNYLLNNMDVIPDEKTFDVVHDVGASLLLLGGSVLFISGIIHTVQIGYKKEPEYLEASKKLKAVENNMSLSFSPTFDFKNKSAGVAMRLNF
jgi:hypothetical protein